MVYPAHRLSRSRWAPVHWALSACALLGLAAGCGELLGVPDAPRLIEEPVPNASSPAAPDSPDALLAMPAQPAEASSGVAEGGASLVSPIASGDLGTPDVETTAPPILVPDAGPGAAGDDSASDCVPEVGVRVPLDILLILDNSGSMQAQTDAVERALGAFADQLSGGGVDFRIILLSRHRIAARTGASAASTSICVESPLSGLETCPSDAPVLGERFFHYSIKIDADDSLEQVLTTFDEADGFGLAPAGWSEWLRSGALDVLIEITDADSALPAATFLEGLSALAPEHFGADPSRPSFVFHSITGVREKGVDADIYGPDEPIEARICSNVDSNPDNAGEVYQALSSLTGGLRLPLCPPESISLRLDALAADLIVRSTRACPAPSAND